MFGDLARARLVTYSAIFVALITFGGWISIPFFPVPLALQTLFVMLAGAVIKRRGVIPVCLYLVLGAIGLPVFHNGIAGVGVLLGPTGGYLLGFVPAALVVGLSYEHHSNVMRVAGLCLATILILFFGAGWLILTTGMLTSAALIGGIAIFIPGDAVKAYAAYVIAEKLP